MSPRSPTASRDRVLTLDDKNEDKNPKLTAVDWTPAGDAILVQYGEPDRWDRGISRLDLKTKTLTTLARDANLYQGFRLSRDGSTIVFQKSDGTRRPSSTPPIQVSPTSASSPT